MNGKAQRQQLTWPPLLQMMHDEPVIDSSFRNVEKINAPYLNDMLTPVWIKDTESKAVYDKDGNRYELDSDNYLTRNGDKLFQVENKHFVREDVTEEFTKYHDYDLTDSHEAYTIWSPEYKSFYIFIDDQAYATPQLYEEGVIITSRLRIIDNKAYLIVYYDVANVGYVGFYILDTSGNYSQYTKEIKWYRHQIRRNATAEPIYEQFALENASPIINIGKVESDVIGVSLVSSYGKAVDTSKNYFATYFLYNNVVYQLGDDAAPTSETSEVTVTNTYTANFKVSQRWSSTAVTGLVASSDGLTFYDYDNGSISTERTFGDYFPSNTATTVDIEGTDYTIYRYSGLQFKVTLNCYSGQAEDFEIVGTYKGIEYNKEVEEGETSALIDDVPEFIVYGVESGYKPDAFTNVKIIWKETTFDIDATLVTQGKHFTLSKEARETLNAGWLVSPNIVIDDGTLYSFWNICLNYSEANNWNNQSLTAGNIIEESGYMTTHSITDDKFIYTISPIEYVQVTTDYNVARSNSFIANQNIAIDTVKLNNTTATSSYTLYNNGGTAGSEVTTSKYLEYSNSNTTDLRFYPGTIRDSTFNYFGTYKYSGDTVVGNVEDLAIFVVQGYRTPVHNADRFMLGNKATPFNILYNTDASNTCLPQGISYSSNTEAMGTLLTPWQSIDDDFYIVANQNTVIYRDRSNRYYKITIEEGNELKALLDDRYILVNTTSYWNMFDSVLMKKFHYATDYNDRTMFGQTAVPETVLAGANSSGVTTYSRITATAINAAYTIMPMNGVSSMLMSANTRLRVGVGVEKAFNCLIEEDNDTQPIDIYFGDVGGTAPSYRYSIYPYSVNDKIIRFDLIGSSYTTSSILYYSPNIFTEYVSGAGNNDMVKETYSTFTLTYYDQQPFFLYNATSEVSSKNGDEIYFFVLQGQFYAFMNEKIYSMVYSNGSISSQDAIIDCRGMKFVGNNPQIAFFWSPRDRAFYSFTGDAILTHLYNANKFNDVRNHWYDETTQSVYVATDIGLLVFGQKNSYLFENWKDVTLCQFSNDTISHITNGDTTINLSYYAKEDYEVLPLDLETSFYGLGNNEYTSIDRWDIVLFDTIGDYHSSEITVGVRSITDVTVKSEERTFKITPDMWDKWSHSLLLRYVPKLQKGQGIRLYVKTPEVIQRIVPHISDMSTGTVTRRGV